MGSVYTPDILVDRWNIFFFGIWREVVCKSYNNEAIMRGETIMILYMLFAQRRCEMRPLCRGK